MSIEVRNVSKHFGQVRALNRLNLTVADGELLALLGPSGSGKSTLLRIIAGLECANPVPGDQGPRILFNNEPVDQRNLRHRGVGFVFQHYSLFKHLTVFENIAFGLRVRPRKTRPDRETIRKKVVDLLHLVQLESLARRYPHQLSGGQRQRVALARALAVEPAVLLLDEPFGALDAKVRSELRSWLRRLHDEIHITSVFVMDFIGASNRFKDWLVKPARQAKSARPAGSVGLVGPTAGLLEETEAESETEYYVRPHEIVIRDTPAWRLLPWKSLVQATIKAVRTAGTSVKVELEDQYGRPVLVDLPHKGFKARNLVPGKKVLLEFKRFRRFAKTGPSSC